MGKNKRWTEQEDEVLRENYGKIPFKKISSILVGRTHHSITNRAWTIGVTRSLNKWLKEYDEFVILNHLKMTTTQIGKVLGVHKDTVLNASKRLGILCFDPRRSVVYIDSEVKECFDCNERLPHKFFSISNRGLGGIRGICKTCVQRSDRKRKYGLSHEDFTRLLEQQNYTCARQGCDTKHIEEKPLHVDHCHETNIIRGLLCFNCNSALGKLGDSVESIEKVLEYLKRGTE